MRAPVLVSLIGSDGHTWKHEEWNVRPLRGGQRFGDTARTNFFSSLLFAFDLAPRRFTNTISLSLLHTQMGLLSMHGAFRCSHNLCHSHARKCDQKVVCGGFKRGRICWISLWHGGCCMAYEKIVCTDQPSVLPLLETHANCRKWSDSTWKVTNTWNY